MGWLWSACAGLEPASPHYAMRCATSCTIGTISRDCGLSVVTRGELTQRFRLSQAYAYIIPHFSAPKLAKFAKKKAAIAGRRLFIIKLPPYSLALFLLSCIFPPKKAGQSPPPMCCHHSSFGIAANSSSVGYAALSPPNINSSSDSTACQPPPKIKKLAALTTNLLSYALSSSSLTTRTRPY